MNYKTTEIINYTLAIQWDTNSEFLEMDILFKKINKNFLLCCHAKILIKIKKFKSILKLFNGKMPKSNIKIIGIYNNYKVSKI